ncbi:ankyrin repeat containing protein [Finch poxvirus]|uniref:Ankyrin repeat containing protein n=2 Tax=unclassified Avipoxvirus TaxID=336487 RepID=A0AAT9UQ38_9POXV|nr:ankyrin repeat containing protein [Finch poxvirus]UOX39061.1 ankyrin repeat containing protein [Finch poxvirus]
MNKLIRAIKRGNRKIIRQVIKSGDGIISRFYKSTRSFPGYIAAIKYKKVDSLLELLDCNVIDKTQLDFIFKCAVSSAVNAYCKRWYKNYDNNLDTARNIVKILADNGATPNYFNIAISYKDEWMVKFLVDKGVDYKSEGLMYKPIDHEMYLIIKTFISNNPNTVILGKTVLQHAIESSNTSLVATLIEEGADVNIRNSETHKHNAELAASKGNSKVLKMLIDAGVDINSYTYYPAIYYSVRNGHLMMTRLLLKNGSILFTDNEGESLIKYAVAVRGHNYSLTKLLLKYGATISGNHEKYVTNINNLYNTYYRDSIINNTRIIMLLIDNGLKINDNSTVLYYLCHYNSIRVFKKLIRNIPDNNLRCGNVLDPMLKDNKRMKLTKYLIRMGAIIEPRTQDRKLHDDLNPLFRAVYYAADKKIKILLDNGANINASCDTHGTVMRKIYLNNLFFYNNFRYHTRKNEKVIRILIPYLLWSGIRDNSVSNTIEYNQNIELVNEIMYMKEVKRICDLELKRMKGIVICQHRKVTLYDFLSYRKEMDLMIITNTSNIMSKYNNSLNLFKRIIRNRKIELINKRKNIYAILEHFNSISDNTNRLYSLPFETKFKIFSYLTYKDLEHISKGVLNNTEKKG